MMKQEERRIGDGGSGGGSSSNASTRRKQQPIEYSCGCRYTFNHHITLVHVYSEHEKELIAFHSWLVYI